MTDIQLHKVTPGRRSWIGYARIIRSIHDGVTSSKALAEAHGMRTESMRDVLRRMRSLGLVQICGQEVAANHLPVPLWTVGAVDDKCFPTNGPLQPNPELIAFANMIRLIQARPMTSKALAAATGLSQERVGFFLRDCDRELRMVHIVGHSGSRKKPGGVPAAIYGYGFDQPNAERPRPRTAKEQNRFDYRKKLMREQKRASLLQLCANASVFSLALHAA